MAEKKPFKFESWMLGLVIIPIGITIAVVNVLNKGTGELGGGCTQNDDCANGMQCVEIDGNAACTQQCYPGTMPCPGGASCTPVEMSVGGNTVPMYWCTPTGG